MRLGGGVGGAAGGMWCQAAMEFALASGMYKAQSFLRDGRVDVFPCCSQESLDFCVVSRY